MSRLYSMPGVRPGLKRRGGAGRVVIGSTFRGAATARNLVPVEDVKPRSVAPQTEARKRDVAEAYEFVRDCPGSAKDRLHAVRAEAASIEPDLA
jgi:hypothetical protein